MSEPSAIPESQSRFTRDGLEAQCLRILQQIDATHYRSLSDAACIFGAVNIAAFIRTRDAEREIEIRKGGLDALKHAAENDMLRMVLGSIEGYPNAGGDINIMTALESLLNDARKQAFEEAAEHRPFEYDGRKWDWECECGAHGHWSGDDNWKTHVLAQATAPAVPEKEKNE